MMSMMMPSDSGHNNPNQPHIIDEQFMKAQLSSTYPSAPMEYVNLFTNENVRQGKVPPPPPIIKDSYISFGKSIDPNDVLIRSLDSQGIQCLYNTANDESDETSTAITTTTATSATTNTKKINTNNHKRELKKLNHSILIAYLDLLEILVKAPNTLTEETSTATTNNATVAVAGSSTGTNSDQQQTAQQAAIDSSALMQRTLREQKLNDIELLFINMHHLINELRPHQARDNIRCILEMQKQQRIDTANKFKAHIFKIVDLLKICINSIQSDPTGKCSAYLDELNGLLRNANGLTNALDKFNNGGGMESSSDVVMEDQDVDMRPVEENNNNVRKMDSSTVGGTIVRSNNGLGNKNCDLKDLILCGLIDDYLTKENEF